MFKCHNRSAIRYDLSGMQRAAGVWELLEATFDLIVTGTVSSKGLPSADFSGHRSHAAMAQSCPSFTGPDPLVWGVVSYEEDKSQIYKHKSLDHISGEVIARLIHFGGK